MRALELRQPLVYGYAAAALAFSAALLSFSARRGTPELCGWLAAYVLIAVVSLRWPARGPLAAGAAALLLGFVRTHRAGFNLDLGLALIALAVGLHLIERARRERVLRLDLAEAALLALAAWSLVSLAFTAWRVRAFSPAPGFAYHTYQFNAAGFASDEALLRAIIGAAATFTWFGLYAWARRVPLERRALNALVFALLLLNTAALLVQRYAAPEFLHPAGWPAINRLNGVTSFCYALGDVALALYLLLPAWGVARGAWAVLSAASVAMLAYASFASGSRTAFLTMVLVATLWAAAHGLRLSRARRGRAALVAAGAAALLVAATVAAYRLTPATQESPLGRLKDGIERQGVVGHLVSQRLATYPLIFRVLAEYPLSGVGAGLYLAEVSKQRALLAPELKLEEGFLLESFAPNQFLNTGVELGVPAMLALTAAFLWAGVSWWRWRGTAQEGGPGALDTGISLLALVAALQLGPSLYNSEAVVFLWLIAGIAAGHATPGAAPAGAGPHWREPRPHGAGLVVAGSVVLAVAGHLWSAPALAVERQWQQLRWRIGIGMLPEQPDGRWSRPEATFSLDRAEPAVVVRWHAGDPSAPDYRARVSWYVDGVLIQRTPARPGLILESLLPLPRVAGYKRISVRVDPPFVPTDPRARRQGPLGVFVHSIRPQQE